MHCARQLFQWDKDIVVARAPGRLDVLGGISDYSGSLVLQQPTSEACHVAVQLLPCSDARHEPQCAAVSFHADGVHRVPQFRCSMSSLFPIGKPLPYDEAQKLFKEDARNSWAAYTVGCILVLAHELNVAVRAHEMAILVSSDVPEGKGVSSSAAIEVSTMKAILGALQIELPGRDLALLCVKVENLVVGAPCGTMDQMACTLGNAQELFALQCQPAELQPAVSIPHSVRFWGIDSGERHSVGGDSYGSVRIGAFMGLRIASQAAYNRQKSLHGAGAELKAGEPAEAASNKRRKTEAQGTLIRSSRDCPAPMFGGFLANLTPSAWVNWVEEALPENMLGAEFLEKYGTHYDVATTSVDPQARYAVRVPTAHPIFESHRVAVFRQVLCGPENSDQLLLLGELMRQSHESYSQCKLGSPGTDRLVNLVQEHMEAARKKGLMPHLSGAKITGGGSGGTVCIVGAATAEAEAVVQEIIQVYAKERNLAGLPQVFRGSSMGAMTFGHVLLSSGALDL
ncbi:ribosomal protein S5 domain 2-type protein [Dunaliella salina]|uniref:Ribosomal protein S5 domain 2-type protein n=1 Tax=Dunaliella salina TaxID=3046 RepID=A0ABQ7G0J5_DUNSA|nr:ribosomal protein S5 domain 2-type protein [Dunaliella salina]|eukprot:KAF5828128.1 ribosomal protein S5 domain 2-type protein [Dunaliella salina]